MTSVITLHWLERSRSQRIAWLLEELGLEYELKLYHRDKGQKADTALKKVFPSGKSPVLEISYTDGRPPLILAESAHIANYLIRKYSEDSLLIPNDEEGEDQVEYLEFFSESSIQPHLTMVAVLGVGLSRAPMLMASVIGKFISKLKEVYLSVEVSNNFGILESILAKNLDSAGTDSLFFVQNKLTAADILLHFSVNVVLVRQRFDNVSSSQFPLLKRWLDQVEKRPAFLKAVERVKSESKGEYEIFA